MVYLDKIKNIINKILAANLQKSYCKYIAALLLFGSNGIIASQIAMPSYEIVLLRTMIGALMLIAIFFLSKQKPTFLAHKKDFLFISISGMAMGASWMFLYEAYDQIGVGISSLLYYCGPIIVMILAPVLFKERLTWYKIAGFVTVLCGVFLVNGNAFNDGKSLTGILYGVFAAVLYALMVITNKKSAAVKGMENTVLQIAVSFLTVAVFVACKSGFALQIHHSDWLWIGILGLLNTGIGCYFYFSSIGNLPVQTVATCGYLEPLAAVVLSVIFLKETMLPLQIIGAVLIIGGAVFGEYATQKSHRQHLISPHQ